MGAKNTARADPNAEYLSLRDASTITGLPIGFIRRGCRSGSIPHVICGQAIYVHVASLRKFLDDCRSDSHTGRAI